LPEPEGSIRPWDVILGEIETIISATTDTNVTYGEEGTAITMEPWRYGDGPISYEYEIEQTGTIGAQIKELKGITLTLVDV